VDGKLLDYQYKEHISNFRTWIERAAPYECVLYKQNMGEYLSIDKTTLSQGELYTIVTNKEGNGKQRSLVSMVSGTKADEVIFRYQWNRLKFTIQQKAKA
jgi:hypothetical protein